jgi:hypothetical protein
MCNSRNCAGEYMESMEEGWLLRCQVYGKVRRNLTAAQSSGHEPDVTVCFSICTHTHSVCSRILRVFVLAENWLNMCRQHSSEAQEFLHELIQALNFIAVAVCSYTSRKRIACMHMWHSTYSYICMYATFASRSQGFKATYASLLTVDFPLYSNVLLLHNINMSVCMRAANGSDATQWHWRGICLRFQPYVTGHDGVHFMPLLVSTCVVCLSSIKHKQPSMRGCCHSYVAYTYTHTRQTFPTSEPRFSAVLQRAELLTMPPPNACVDDAGKRLVLRACTFNNMGCYYRMRGKLLLALQVCLPLLPSTCVCLCKYAYIYIYIYIHIEEHA